MTHATSSSALFDGRSVTHVPLPRNAKAVLLPFLWVLASLGTAFLILGIVFAVAAQKDREAGRVIVAEQRGSAGYLSRVTDAMTQSLGRPGAF